MEEEEFEAPELPKRFPCWCKAKYSWGGEHQRDLGFVEGDLIECLNAGDGSWWTGRLRRDRRKVGMFPSNFVRVLHEDYVPSPMRGSSPMPGGSPSPSPSPTKSKPFRKPFQAYSAPDPGAQKRAELRQREIDAVPRTPSPAPRPKYVRTQSPQRFNGYISSRAPSPNPYVARAPSPSPSFPPPRAESPSGIFSTEAEQGSPPPPPPPHRSAFGVQNSIGFHEHRDQYSNDFHRPRSLTPDSTTPERTGHTPSPLTHAMNDVMSSLDDMGVSEHSALSQHEIPSQVNLDPWAPEAYKIVPVYHRTPPDNHTTPRPSTSIGIDIDRDYEGSKNRPNHRRSRTDFSPEDPPQLSNYVERMESRLGKMKKHSQSPGPPSPPGKYWNVEDPPDVPPKQSHLRSKSPFGRPKSPFGRPKSPFGRPKSPFTRSRSPDMPLHPVDPRSKSSMGDYGPPPMLRHRKSAYEVGKSILGRTFTNKSSSTNASSAVQSTTTNSTSSTQATGRSLMSGKSAGAYSATSAGSYARKQAEKYGRAQSAMGIRKEVDFDGGRPETPFSGITYHSSHASGPSRPKSQAGWRSEDVTPKAKKSNFFKRMVESAKTGAANARSTIAISDMGKSKSTGIGSSFGIQYRNANDAAKDMGLGTGSENEWVRVRRDINRSNSLSKYERTERKERCLMMDFPVIDPVAQLYEFMDGDEDSDGRPVEEPTNFQNTSLSLVDKNARFINSLPPMTNPVSLATGFVCRPYKNDVQRLRAIFTWCAEKIIWEDDFEGDVDTKRVVLSKRGGTEEIVFLVLEMCQAVGINCNVIRGYLKPPGEAIEAERIPHPNHFWNSVLVENEWRIMDCSLASPSHPKRHLYSSAPGDKAESWYFLTRPSEICWTHVPCHDEDQHLVPNVEPQILLHLPCACPPFFKHRLQMIEYDTSLIRIEDLEMVHIKFSVPSDIECAAEVEALILSKDEDGDFYETEKLAKMAALTQPSWVSGQKQYTVKALLPPGTSSLGLLKVYAGKRGLMNSIHIPHPVAFTLPILHHGNGDDGYEFFTRYATPHASRHDLYVMQPQCKRLVVGNTFVFAIRQHPAAPQLTEDAVTEASGGVVSTRDGGRSPGPGTSQDGNLPANLPVVRPSSSMSSNASFAASHSSNGLPTGKNFARAKLAIQSPGGKILRLQRKDGRTSSGGKIDGDDSLGPDGGVYETIIKCGERGIWRACVLADRNARWCVFAEWNCV